MTNNARMTPVYLSQMYELKEKDHSAWLMLKDESSSENKSDIALTSIAEDHKWGVFSKLESSTWRINTAELAADMGNIIESFCQTFGIQEDHAGKKDEHHQLSSSKNKRISKNIYKFSGVFGSFNSSDCIHDILTYISFTRKRSRSLFSRK